MGTLKKILLFLGDAAILYLSLLITLFIRYGFGGYDSFWNEHLGPFSLVILIWVIVFQISGLYEIKNLKNDVGFFRILSAAMGVNILIAIALFYLFPFGIAPKTNLFIFAGVAAILVSFWRSAFNSLSAKITRETVLILSKSETAGEISEYLAKNPQLGYSVLENENNWDKASILIASGSESDGARNEAIYRQMLKGTRIISVAAFYEQIFGRTPLSELDEDWFLEILAQKRNFYEIIKTVFETLTAILMLIALSPIFLIVAVLVKISSRGPAVYKQIRSGKNNSEFTLYKFRTMRADAEKTGPQWAQTKDPRVTPIGKFLRATHLDELPQLINIIKGDLSFVGPRPERPEFVEILRKEISYYEIRGLVRPGLTGWAQINYKYTSSVEDTRKKVEYDIFYIKNRSVILDMAIMLKTAKSIFVNSK
ncbi:MAG: sugar transferase [Minisyncoccia bacterium]